MDIRQLRHFLALVEEGSFTAAARREFIVQSGISSSIRALESDLGAELYVKGTRPLRLTAEGRALIPAAREALRGFNAVRDVVGRAGQRLTGLLTVGIFTHVEHLVPLTKVLSRMTFLHPGLELELIQLPSEEMLRQVISGQLDCALLSAPQTVPREVEVTALASEPLVLAGSHDHPLRRSRSLTMQDLSGERFVEMPRHWAVRTDVDRVFRATGVYRHRVCECDDWGVALDLVAGGVGLAFLPREIAEWGKDLRVWHRTLTDVELVRPVDLVVPTERTVTPAAALLRTELIAAMKTGER